MRSAFAREAVYVRSAAGLSGADVARATGVRPSTVRSWFAQTRSPARPRAAERLVELAALVERLTRVMAPDYIAVWLRKPNPALNDGKPLDVIRKGGYVRVSRIVAALESPPAV